MSLFFSHSVAHNVFDKFFTDYPKRFSDTTIAWPMISNGLASRRTGHYTVHLHTFVLMMMYMQRFETSVDVLERHPTTLLGDADRRQCHYDQSRDELFFDRHRPSFEAIFAYYQTGCRRLRRPHDVPEDVFVEEAMFFEIEDEVCLQ